MELGNAFKDIDPVLNQWSTKNGLTVFRHEAREIFIVDNKGAKYSIRVEPKNLFGQYKLVASSDHQSWTRKSSRKQIETALDAAFGEVGKWMEATGGERKWAS